MWGDLPKLHAWYLHYCMNSFIYQDGKGHCMHYVIIMEFFLLTEATGENKGKFYAGEKYQLFW